MHPVSVGPHSQVRHHRSHSRQPGPPPAQQVHPPLNPDPPSSHPSIRHQVPLLQHPVTSPLHQVPTGSHPIRQLPQRPVQLPPNAPLNVGQRRQRSHPSRLAVGFQQQQKQTLLARRTPGLRPLQHHTPLWHHQPLHLQFVQMPHLPPPPHKEHMLAVVWPHKQNTPAA